MAAVLIHLFYLAVLALVAAAAVYVYKTPPQEALPPGEGSPPEDGPPSDAGDAGAGEGGS